MYPFQIPAIFEQVGILYRYTYYNIKVNTSGGREREINREFYIKTVLIPKAK